LPVYLPAKRPDSLLFTNNIIITIKNIKNINNTVFLLNKGIDLLSNKTNYRLGSTKVKPIIIYPNSLFNALDNNRGKSGIYRLIYYIGNKSYVGSSEYLYTRLRCYYNINYLKRKVLVYIKPYCFMVMKTLKTLVYKY